MPGPTGREAVSLLRCDPTLGATRVEVREVGECVVVGPAVARFALQVVMSIILPTALIAAALAAWRLADGPQRNLNISTEGVVAIASVAWLLFVIAAIHGLRQEASTRRTSPILIASRRDHTLHFPRFGITVPLNEWTEIISVHGRVAGAGRESDRAAPRWVWQGICRTRAAPDAPPFDVLVAPEDARAPMLRLASALSVRYRLMELPKDEILVA